MSEISRVDHKFLRISRLLLHEILCGLISILWLCFSFVVNKDRDIRMITKSKT